MTYRSMSLWKTTELAVLKQHYGTAGAHGVHAMLPHRSIAAIRGKAASEGIKGIRCTTLGKKIARIYPQRDDIDMAIREGYMRATRRGAIKELAARIGRPAWWVQKRAASLGVTRSNRTRVDCWKPEELAIVEQWATAGLDVIVSKLRRAGFQRTPTAVAVCMKRRRIDSSDPDMLTSIDVGTLLGRDPATIADWVNRRSLRAKIVGGGPHGKYLIHRRDLRAWIAGHPEYIDLRRVDQAWFWDVMFPGAQVTKMPSQAAREAA